MRILRIDSWDGSPGGAQDYVREVSAELEARGHPNRALNVTTVLPPRPIPGQDFLKIEPMGRRRLAHDLVDAPELWTEFWRLHREFRPDIVQLHHFDAGFATIARIVRRLETPLVFSAHDAELVCPISTLVRPGNVICEGGVRYRCLFTGCKVGFGGPYNLWQTHLFDRDVRAKVRAYLCPSHSLTDYLDAHGYRPAIHLPSFARIPPSVVAAPTRRTAGGSPPTLGYIGRLEWYKGVHDLLDSLPTLARRVPGVRVDIAGTGPFQGELERQASRVGVADRILWSGRVSGQEKEGWFGRVDAVVVPSNMWENFPLVALESLARGVPVIATRIGGIPDIVVDGETGRLVPISDPGALASAGEEILLDEAKRTTWGLEGRRRVLSMFTPEVHVNRLIRVYERVLAGEPLLSRMEAAVLAPGDRAAAEAMN